MGLFFMAQWLKPHLYKKRVDPNNMILFFTLSIKNSFSVLDAQPTSQARQHKVVHVFCKL